LNSVFYQKDEAERAKNKAVELYERGQKKYVSRSEPIGLDKLLTKVYWFRNDPDAFFLEVNKSNTINDVTNSWHIIDSKALFDDYVSSLDVRGIRQHNLYDEMMGSSASSSLRRFLRDDNKELIVAARKREIEDFERRLENAKVKCDVEEFGGRRSGRLAPNAKSELAKIMEEMELAEKKFEEEMNAKAPDYHALTGIDLLKEYEKEIKGSFRCGHLWSDRGSNVVGVIASDILQLESLCDDLIPWERVDVSRDVWRDKLINAVESWNHGVTFYLGPKKPDSHEGAKSDGEVPACKESPHRNAPTGNISIAGLLQILKVIMTCFIFHLDLHGHAPNYST